MNLLYRSLRRGSQLTRGFPEEHNGGKLCKDSQERCVGVVYTLNSAIFEKWVRFKNLWVLKNTI